MAIGGFIKKLGRVFGFRREDQVTAIPVPVASAVDGVLLQMEKDLENFTAKHQTEPTSKLPTYKRGEYDSPAMRKHDAETVPIFNEIIAAGATSYNDICHKLNERGVLTRGGSTWDRSTVHRFIQRTGIEFQSMGIFPGGNQHPAPGPLTVTLVDGRVRKFRRSPNEIALGLTHEQALQYRRKGTLPIGAIAKKEGAVFDLPKTETYPGRGVRVRERKAKVIDLPKPTKDQQEYLEKASVTKPVDVTDRVTANAFRHADIDPIAMLSPRIQVRARAMAAAKSKGRPVLTTAELDEIERNLAEGRITICPPCTDSSGFNHLKGCQS